MHRKGWFPVHEQQGSARDQLRATSIRHYRTTAWTLARVPGWQLTSHAERRAIVDHVRGLYRRDATVAELDAYLFEQVTRRLQSISHEERLELSLRVASTAFALRVPGGAQ